MKITSTINVTEIDGKRLYYSFLAGAKNLFDNQKHLNKLNVFPVPDADTGTNLASTFQSIIDNVIPVPHVRDTSVAIAQAALSGARGNSGIILAQFLYGFSNEMSNSGTLTVEDFALQLKNAVKYAYEAIANPMEGTIITVMKDWADAVDKLKDKTDDFQELFTHSLQKAQASLRETAKRMEVLARTRIVDAGAQGFVYFLEGILSFFLETNLRKLLAPRVIVKSEEIYDNHEAITFRYCTEAFLANVKCSIEDIRKKLASMGDSMVVAGSSERMRIHIHSDEPSKVFALLTRFSNIVSQKVDDMVQQHEISHKPWSKIGLVMDSCGDLPRELMDKYQISTLPLILNAYGNQYLDKLTITPELFYSFLDKKGDYPTTSQPSSKDTYNKLSYLSSHFESIIVLNLSAQLSGTFSSSTMAAKSVSEESGRTISVIDTQTITGGQGLVALRAAEAIENGASHEEVLKQLEDWKTKGLTLVGVKTLKYFVKGGRVSPLTGIIGNLLNLKPIVSIDSNGKAYTFGKSFSRKASLQQIVNKVVDEAKTRKIHSFAVNYTNKEERYNAEKFAKQVELATGISCRFVMSASPVAGVSGGIGTIVLSVLFE
jgi:DAK2 domain fusion protein YloV